MFAENGSCINGLAAESFGRNACLQNALFTFVA